MAGFLAERGAYHITAINTVRPTHRQGILQALLTVAFQRRKGGEDKETAERDLTGLEL